MSDSHQTGSQRPGHVILNVNVLDVGITHDAWRSSDLHPLSFVDIDYFTEIGRIAERGTLDGYFLADGPGLREDPRLKPSRSLEPTIILGAVAAATEHIGLIGTASTTFNDPWELAHRFLSLDNVSGGRVAWNVVTTYSQEIAGNFGLTALPDRDARYRRAAEFVDVVEQLWASARVGRPVAHDGEFFSVVGTLPVPPSRQGQPLLVQAGGSPAGRALAGRHAHAVFSAELSLRAGITHYEQVKAAAVAAGRDREHVRILPGLITVIGSTEAEARERDESAARSAPDQNALNRLAVTLGVDPGSLELDAPLPAHVVDSIDAPSTFAGSLGFREAVVWLAQEERLTVRGLLTHIGGGFGHRKIVGTPEQVADTIETWWNAGAADGFNLMPDRFPDGLEIFVDEVVPILRERGLFRHEYGESTLRERFSVPSPISESTTQQRRTS